MVFEPEDMVLRVRGYGSLVILVSASVPLGQIWVLNWVGVGPRGFGDKRIGAWA